MRHPAAPNSNLIKLCEAVIAINRRIMAGEIGCDLQKQLSLCETLMAELEACASDMSEWPDVIECVNHPD